MYRLIVFYMEEYLIMSFDQVVFASECLDVEDYIKDHLDEISSKVIKENNRLDIVKLRSEINRAIDLVSRDIAVIYKQHRQQVLLYGIDKFKSLKNVK